MAQIEIRHSSPADSEAVRRIYACPEVYASTLQLPWPTGERWQQRLSDDAPGRYSLVAEADGLVVGQIGLEAYQSPRRKHAGGFGMGVLDGWRGQGVGSRLLGAVIDLADNWLDLSRLELEVYCDNQAAIALYRKFGFIVEGEAQGFAFRNGAFIDVYYMARRRPAVGTSA